MATKISFKQINQLAIPAIFSGIAESLITLTDLAMVGNMKNNPGEALAAVGLAGSFLSGLIWILAQTKTSLSSIVSQHFGANQLKRIEPLVAQALYFNILLSLLVLFSTWLMAESIFELYNAEGIVLNYTIDYYRIRVLGFPLTLISFTLFGAFRGLQNTFWAMVCALTAAVLNVVLDYLLIYGWTDYIPVFGLQGAGYASLIAQSVMVILAFYYYFRKTPFGLNPGRRLHPQLKHYISLSFNFILRTASLNVAFYFANASATGYGKEYIAAQSILMNLWLFFSFFIDGYAGAGNAMAGRLMGERNYPKLWILSKDISRYSVTVACILMAFCFGFYEDIGRLFNQDASILYQFQQVFWIVLLLQPINTIAYVFDGLFKGLGDAKLLRNNLIIATFLGFLPTLFITDYFGLKLHGIWIAFGIWMLIRSFPLVYLFKKKVDLHSGN